MSRKGIKMNSKWEDTFRRTPSLQFIIEDNPFCDMIKVKLLDHEYRYTVMWYINRADAKQKDVVIENTKARLMDTWDMEKTSGTIKTFYKRNPTPCRHPMSEL